MKKKILFLAILLFAATVSFAVEPYSISSGLIGSSQVVGTSGGNYVLVSVEAITDGTNDATVNVYNGTSASGTALVKLYCVAAARFCGADFPFPLIANSGIYVQISGSGTPGAIIGYINR